MASNELGTLAHEPFIEPVYPEGIPKGSRRHLRRRKVRFSHGTVKVKHTDFNAHIQQQMEVWQSNRKFCPQPHTTTEMSRNYPANTQIQKFLEESYNKERDCRLGWYFKTQQSGNANTVSKQFDVFRKKIEAACPKPTDALLQVKSVKPKSYHKRIITYDDNLMKMAGQTRNASLTVDMLPVPKPVRDKLYDGFTKEGKGRYHYLQSRYRDIPENKYQFPVLSSWEYGWRLGDVISKEEIKKPANARTRIVADTFYTRTGIPALQRTTTF